jgi:hypothetical protein
MIPFNEWGSNEELKNGGPTHGGTIEQQYWPTIPFMEKRGLRPRGGI